MIAVATSVVTRSKRAVLRSALGMEMYCIIVCTMAQIRMAFGKHGVARFMGHLDFHRALERALRRAGLDLAYSQGFNPQPRMQMASALPLGCTSEAELLDVWFTSETEPDFVVGKLRPVAPPGVRILAACLVGEKQKSLQSRLVSVGYTVGLAKKMNLHEIKERIDELMYRAAILRLRRGKKYDLRPLIEKLSLATNGEGEPVILMRLSARPSATGRPEEVAAALDLGECHYHRTALYFC